MSYTKGPWQRLIRAEYGDFGSKLGDDLIGIRASDGRLVCTFDDDFGTDSPADAHLISAAPELLEALEWMLRPGGFTPESKAFARSVISKARGEKT